MLKSHQDLGWQVECSKSHRHSRIPIMGCGNYSIWSCTPVYPRNYLIMLRKKSKKWNYLLLQPN